MTTETKADDFKVGDRVWCILHGEGVVTAIRKWEEFIEYPVRVTYCNVDDHNYYTLDGKFYKEGPRALFFSEPKIEASVTRPFVPTLVGKTVIMEYFDGTRTEPVMVIAESKDEVLYRSGLNYKSDLTAIYEVSSENLLK